MNIRKFATVAVAASLLLGTAGCTFMNPIASRIEYAPSDGTQASLENVDARNFMYLSDGAGHAALFGSLVNRGLDSASVKLQYTDATSNATKQAYFTLLPSQKLDFGYNGTSPLNYNLAGKPGSTVTVWVSAGSETGKEMNVPVLDGTLAEYSDLVKQLGGAAPKVDPSATPSATPSPTPSN
jgi:hypothetical protein